MELDLKALGSIKFWPRKLLIVAAILAVDLCLILYVVAFFADTVTEQEMQLQAARAGVQTTRVTLAGVRADVAAVEALRQTYEKMTAPGVVSPPDRVALVRSIDDMRARHRLSGVHFRFSPEAVTGLPGSSYQVMEMPVELMGESLLDSDLIAFWQEAIMAVSPNFALTSFTLERLHPPTPAILQMIRDGRQQALVSGKIEFRALSLRRPGSKGDGL